MSARDFEEIFRDETGRLLLSKWEAERLGPGDKGPLHMAAEGEDQGDTEASLEAAAPDLAGDEIEEAQLRTSATSRTSLAAR